MKTVQRQLIDEWIHENGPDGLAKLAITSGVSSSMISKIRTGRVPYRPLTRRALAQALGVSEGELFPEERAKGKRAAG